jgi:putative ATP-binding cassette transporter
VDLIKFLIRSARGLVLGTMLASAVSGILGAGLIAVVNRALSQGGGGKLIIAAFLLIAAGKIFTACASQIMLVQFAQNTVLRLCRSLCEKVLAAPFAKLEVLGAPRILTTLTDDVAILTGAVQAIPTLATNLAIMLGCAVYLAWISWHLFLISAAIVAFGAVGYRLLMRKAMAPIAAAREGRDRLFADFRTLIEGIKELKLHRARRDDFVRGELEATMEHLRQENISATRQYTYADAWSQFLFLGLIATLLFAAPRVVSLNTQTLTAYVFAALYMMSPMWTVLGAAPTFMRGRVSLAKIQQLGDTLGEVGPDTSAAQPREAPVVRPVRIEFQGATYAYAPPDSDSAGFTLGPFDLSLSSGEVVFITGGNGSGKSTLVKLLTGLYLPTDGAIRLNGRLLDEVSRETYRELFSVVFADFHLFGKLFGLDASRREHEIQRYLNVLHMQDKVSVRDGRFSSIALSTGQRKRLALLTAYLEDRPVYVFDEWAADQDPTYKAVFYNTLLPELKARGKCVVVITHDDRYFNRGDRVVKVEAGRVTELEYLQSLDVGSAAVQ